MDYLAREFIDYLFSIGIVSKDKTKELIELYQGISKEQQSINALNNKTAFSIDTMIALIKKLFPNFNSEICLNVVTMFFENRKQKQIKKLRIAVIIGLRTRRVCLWRHYNKWKRGMIEYLKKSKLMQQQLLKLKNKGDQRVIDKLSKPIKLNNKQSIYLLETSLNKREKEDLNECTFRPVINSTERLKTKPNVNGNDNSNSNTNTTAQTFIQRGIKPIKQTESIYDRLYFDKDKYNFKKQILNLKIDTIQASKAPFTPRLYASPRNIKYQTSNSQHKKTFDERQRSFIDIRYKSIERIKTEMEQCIVKEATFSPKINSNRNIIKSLSKRNTFNKSAHYSNCNNESSAHLRLYNDHFLRKEKSLQRLNNQTEASYTKIPQTTINQSPRMKKRSVDLSNIQQLYENYKTKKLRAYKTKQRVEEEEGLTFSPYLQNKDTKYHRDINMNFFEREQKLIDDKQEFIERNKRNDIRKTRDNQIGFKNNYTREEKDEIAKRIIERLYHRQCLKNYANPIEAETMSCIKDNNNIVDSYGVNTIERISSMSSEIEQNGLTKDNNRKGIENAFNVNLYYNKDRDRDNDNDIKQNQVTIICINNFIDKDRDCRIEEDQEKYNDRIILLENHPIFKKKTEQNSAVNTNNTNEISIIPFEKYIN